MIYIQEIIYEKTFTWLNLKDLKFTHYADIGTFSNVR